MDNLEIEKYINQFKAEKDIFIKAKILYFLNKNKGIRIVDLAKIIGLKPAYICHFLRLTKLPEIVIDGYYGKMISASHLFIISRLKTKEAIIELYEKILEKNLTINETDNLVRELIYQVKNQGDYLSSEEKNRLIKAIESLANNVKVKLIQTRTKGKLIIEIKGNLKETTKILKKIKKLIEID